jgi:hypothetical protein
MDKPVKPMLTLIRSEHASAAKRRASRGTSGKRLFVEGGDGRSAWALRWKDLILAHVADLGGPELLSEAQISLCRRVAAMEIALEQLEARMSTGEPIDIGVYARLTGCLCRLFALLGTRGRAKSLDPQSELVRALQAYPPTAFDDDADDGDEFGMDREPGEA